LFIVVNEELMSFILRTLNVSFQDVTCVFILDFVLSCLFYAVDEMNGSFRKI